MSEASSSPFLDPEWMEAQRRYWGAWLDLARKGGAKPDDAQAWSHAARRWWQAAAKETPAASHAFFERLIEQGSAYFDLTDGLRDALGAGGGDGAAWRGDFDRAFGELKKTFESGGQAGGPDGSAMMSFWRQPLAAWQQALPALLGGMAAPAGDGASGLPDAMHEAVNRVLGMPGLGLGREWQQDAQEGARLWLQYRRALDDYNAEFRKLGLDTLERLRERVLARAKEGREIDSVRELYDLWVDCGEEAYAAHVATDEYAEIYARLVNSLLAFRRHQQRSADRIAGLLNLPTRRELDAVHRRLHGMRREVGELRRALNELAASAKKAPARRAPRKKKES